MTSFNFIFIFLLFISGVSQALEKSDFEIQVSPYIELLGTDWNNKNLDEISQAQSWETAYSEAGKKKMSFVGNWYRLKIGNWLPQGDWVLIHPLAAKFTLYRNFDGQVHASEHGYKTQSSEKISYRKTAVMLPKIKNDEILYFKISGMSNRSSHHPKIVSPIKFMSVVSNEAPSVAFYYSLILVVALISLFAFFMLKEKIYFYYSMYLFSTIGVFLGIQGYLYQATTHWAPGYSMFFFGMLNFFILLFINDLFKLNTLKHKILIYALSGLSLAFSLFSLAGFTTIAFEGLYTIVTGTQLIIVGISINHIFKDKKDRWILACISFSFLISSLGLLNDRIPIPMSDIIDDAFQPAAFIEALLFAFVLLKRFYYINIEKQHAIELARTKTLESVKLEAEKEKLRANAKIGENAAQIAHDIRSPLSALTMLMSSLSEIPEDKRILARSAINRVNDIANNLLEKSKKQASQINDPAKVDDDKLTVETTLLAALIDSIVSEKRIQLRDRANLMLEAHLENSYGLFAKINPSEFKRVISNIINNAAEAFDPISGGQIDVVLESKGSMVILKISDNGKGIPKHILDKLGQQGVSHGKNGTESGSGLGIYHAMKTIELFGGKFEVNSSEGVGTSIIISLEKVNSPSWFVQKLQLQHKQTIVATDDDNSILEIWKNRLNGLIAEDSYVHLITCSSGDCLGDWIKKNFEEAKSAIYLMDYELLGQSKTGLDLIEFHQLQNRAILVTSRYDEKSILERCNKLGVKLIPKGMAPLVPIQINPPKQKVDLCLVDDDDLVRISWQFVAKDKNLNILTFSDFESFLEGEDSITSDTPIYVDVSLKNGVKGQDVANKMHQLGFKRINLATGYDSKNIEIPKFIESVQGKDFPAEI